MLAQSSITKLVPPHSAVLIWVLRIQTQDFTRVISLASVYLKTCLDVMTSFSHCVCYTLYLPTACLFLPALAGPLPPQVVSLLLLCYWNLYKNRPVGLVQYVD